MTGMITITHEAGEGTLVSGDPRPHHGLVKARGFRWSRSVGWYLPRSRDSRPNMTLIDGLANELRSVGFEVAVEVSQERRSVAEIEADRAERSAARADGLATKAERLVGQADSAYERARSIADTIPLGQPILVGHHSERRHRKDLDRIDAGYRKSFTLSQDAREAERRAAAAEANQRHRESAPVTVRRIAKLETDFRRIQRAITPCPLSNRRHRNMVEGTISCPQCYRDVQVTEFVLAEHGGAQGAYLERCVTRLVDIVEEIDYWQRHLEAIGYELPTRAEWKKGDLVRVRGSVCVVVRVNPKTLTVKPPHVPFTLKYGYEECHHVEPETSAPTH